MAGGFRGRAGVRAYGFRCGGIQSGSNEQGGAERGAVGLARDPTAAQHGASGWEGRARLGEIGASTGGKTATV